MAYSIEWLEKGALIRFHGEMSRADFTNMNEENLCGKCNYTCQGAIHTNFIFMDG